MNVRIYDLGHICAHIGETGPGKPHWDGEGDEVALPSRHEIRPLTF